jgi:hypothetical protein
MSVKNNQSFRQVQAANFQFANAYLHLTGRNFCSGAKSQRPPLREKTPLGGMFRYLFWRLVSAAAILWWLNTKNAQKDSTSKISSAKNDKKKANSLDAAKDFEQVEKKVRI